jgi:hypothetical protein|tara:strand:- start:317 stop:517 length:201 start_codon:yes stop_codon:yes gene_type:complete
MEPHCRPSQAARLSVLLSVSGMISLPLALCIGVIQEVGSDGRFNCEFYDGWEELDLVTLVTCRMLS